MKILILGGDGMLGHQLVESLSSRHEVEATFRSEASMYGAISDYLPKRGHFGVNALDISTLRKVIESTRPGAVVNAIGVIKQRSESSDVIMSLEVNALLPHRLATICADADARLVHISTDCVFSGRQGMYKEDDFADADDLYGRSKFLGELNDENSVTLRTSMIGLELARKKSLVEWFLAQRGQIKGFRRGIFSGFTTLEIARIIECVLVQNTDTHGLFHVSSEPIDKYALLSGLRDRLQRDLVIIPDNEFACDRSLDSSRFQSEFSYAPPSWKSMLDELCDQIRDRQE